jgi:hypothetical protein
MDEIRQNYYRRTINMDITKNSFFLELDLDSKHKASLVAKNIFLKDTLKNDKTYLKKSVKDLKKLYEKDWYEKKVKIKTILSMLKLFKVAESVSEEEYGLFKTYIQHCYVIDTYCYTNKLLVKLYKGRLKDLKHCLIKTYGINENNQDIECCICLENYTQDTMASITVCEHIFHNCCIARWRHINNSCPLCRLKF